MKVLKTTLIILLILFTCGWTSYHTHHYSRNAIVVDIDCIEITAKDNTGHYWKFIGDNFYIGQKITLQMYDNYTDNIITDDIVKRIK